MYSKLTTATRGSTSLDFSRAGSVTGKVKHTLGLIPLHLSP